MTYGLTHDPESDALYIRLRDGEYEETLDFGNPGGGVNVDVDREGYVLGLEFLSMKEYAEVIAEHGGELVVPERIVDESGDHPQGSDAPRQTKRGWEIPWGWVGGSIGLIALLRGTRNRVKR